MRHQLYYPSVPVSRWSGIYYRVPRNTSWLIRLKFNKHCLSSGQFEFLDMVVHSPATVVVDSSDYRLRTTILGRILAYLSSTIFVI